MGVDTVDTVDTVDSHGAVDSHDAVDSEHLFVLQWDGSEQVFEGGHAMSVALEHEYEAIYPRLRLVPQMSGRGTASRRLQVRWMVLGVVMGVVLVLLMLPVRAWGGKTVVGSAPTVGQEYVVHNGDTLSSIATQVGKGDVAGMERRLARELGSTVVVPGEHVLIP